MDILYLLITMNDLIKNNRILYLAELRSGRNKKGTILSDSNGFPVINSEPDNDGHCACAIFTEMFGSTPGSSKLSISKATKAIGISPKECSYIQYKLNDTNLGFSEIADRIESEVFAMCK